MKIFQKVLVGHFFETPCTPSRCCPVSYLYFTFIFTVNRLSLNKCIGDDTKAAARLSLSCIKTKKNKIWRKTIFNMADRIITPCNMACSSGIVTLNSPKRPPYWNSTSGFNFDHITAVEMSYSAPVSEILSKLDHPQQKKMTSC